MLRPFTDKSLHGDLRLSTDNFRQSLTQSQKIALTNAYKVIVGDKATNRSGVLTPNHSVMRFRNRGNLQKVAKTLGVEKVPKGLKALPIQKFNGTAGRVKVRRNKVSISYEGVSKVSYLFPHTAGKSDISPKNANRLLLQADLENPNGRSFVLMAGYYECPIPASSAAGLYEQAIALMAQYKDYQKWMKGVVVYNYKREKDYLNHVRKREKSKVEGRKQLQAKRRFMKRNEAAKAKRRQAAKTKRQWRNAKR